MRATMIYVQITRMMGVNRVRRDFADVLLHHSDNVQQRLGVETVVGKPMHGEALHAQYVCSCLGWGHGLQRINSIPRSQLVTIRRTLSWSIGTRTSSVKRSSRTTKCLRS